MFIVFPDAHGSAQRHTLEHGRNSGYELRQGLLFIGKHDTAGHQGGKLPVGHKGLQQALFFGVNGGGNFKFLIRNFRLYTDNPSPHGMFHSFLLYI